MKSFISVVSFVLISIVIQAQTVPTVGEIFDFNVGDEFHYRRVPFSVPPCVSKKTITSKTFSLDGDTVYYGIHDYSYSSYIDYNPSIHLVYEFSESDYELMYTNLDSLITNPVFSSDTSCFNDTTFLNSPGYWCNAEIVDFSTTCGDFEPTFYTRKYGIGLGCTDAETYYSGDQVYGIFNNMIYYKKGSTECGTPDNIYEGIDDSMIIGLIISIYPNPCSDEILVEQKQENHLEVIISDAQSRIVATACSDDRQIRIDTKSIEPGIYFIRVTDTVDGRSFVSRIIKQ